MPKTIPTNGQTNWGTALNDHIGQLMDPTTGGFNIVADVAERNSKFWADGSTTNDAFANKTVYISSTGTFHAWTISTDPANTRYWRELSKNIASQGWIAGTGSISGYGREIRGTGTRFTSLGLTEGAMVLIPRASGDVKIAIVKVISDTVIDCGTGGLYMGSFANVGNAPSHPSINVSSVSGNTVTFSASITGVGFKPGDYFTNWTPTVGKLSGTGTITSVGTDSLQVSWDVVGTEASTSWWCNRVDTNVTNYKTQAILMSWSDGNDVVGMVRTDGLIQAKSFMLKQAETSGSTNILQVNSSFGSNGTSAGLRIQDTKRSALFGAICKLAGWGSNEGDFVWNYASALGTTNKVHFLCNNAGFLFTSDQLNNSRDLYINKGQVGINNMSPSQSLDVVGHILATGMIIQNSDITLKKDIVEIDSAVSKLSQIKGVTYKWKNPENHGNNETEQLGIIAQDVEKVFPQVVSTGPNGIKSVSYGDMVAPLIQAIKELKAEIDELKKKVA
jgi:Chaperone of endosialidase